MTDWSLNEEFKRLCHSQETKNSDARMHGSDSDLLTGWLPTICENYLFLINVDLK